MKRMLDGLYLVLGTFCLFGFPAALLGFSAMFGDQVMKLLHAGQSATHSVLFQIEAIAIVFGTSLGGLASAIAVFALLWMAARRVKRAAAPPPLPSTPTGRLSVEPQAAVVGHIDHTGTHRRAKARAV